MQRARQTGYYCDTNAFVVQRFFRACGDVKHCLNRLDRILSRSRLTGKHGQSVAHTAINLSAAAIVTPTESGHTARMIAKYRPFLNRVFKHFIG
jgi:pyruvate kinase